MIPASFKYKTVFTIEFADKYAVGGELSGRRVCFRFSEYCYLVIEFPSIIEKSGFPELQYPRAFERFDLDSDSWGTIKMYNKRGDLSKTEVWLSSIIVESYWSIPYQDSMTKVIEDSAKSLIHALQIIKPEALRISSNDLPNYLCKISSSTTFGGLSPKSNIFLSSVIDDRVDRLSIHEIGLGIHSANKTISLPYELLDNARINLDHHDSRAAVLNCATVIEVVLRKRIDMYLNTTRVPVPVKKEVLDHATRYSQQVSLCGKFGIDLNGIPNLQVTVFDLRNRVIHGGHTPTIQEARRAYDSTKHTLQVLKEPMFEH